MSPTPQPTSRTRSCGTGCMYSAAKMRIARSAAISFLNVPYPTLVPRRRSRRFMYACPAGPKPSILIAAFVRAAARGRERAALEASFGERRLEFFDGRGVRGELIAESRGDAGDLLPEGIDLATEVRHLLVR